MQGYPLGDYLYSKFNCLWSDNRLADINAGGDYYIGDSWVNGSSEAVTLLEGLIDNFGK